MSEVADAIAEAAEEIQNSEIFEEILQVIIDVQQELDAASVKVCDGGAMNGSDCSLDADCPDGTCVSTGEVVLDQICGGGTNDGRDCTADTDCPGSTCVSTGDLLIGTICDEGINKGNDCVDDTDCPGGTCGGGVVIPTPNGQVNVNYTCPGWDEGQFDPDYEAEPDPPTGTINLTMTLGSGGIGRVVWGTADNCRYLVPIEGGNCEAAGCYQSSYDGGVALDLGDPVSPGEDITKLIVTFLMEGDIGFDGGTYRINQSFRVTLENTAALVILVDLADPALSETFNYIFGETQAIRDATGVFGCSLEESRCFDRDGNTLFSW